MYRYLFSILSFLLTFPFFIEAEEISPDIRNYNSGNVEVITIDDSQDCCNLPQSRNFSVAGRNYSLAPSWDFSVGGLMFGFVGAPGHPSDMPVEQGKSFEIGINHIIGAKYRNRYSSVSFGFGMTWRNYKITTPDYRFVTVDKVVSTLPYPDDSDPINSRLKIFTLQFPFIFTQKMPFRFLNHRQSLSLGVTFNCNTHGSMVSRWRDVEGHKVKDTSSQIGQRRVSYDLLGVVGLSDDVGVYFRYSPQSVLQGSGQPSFHSFSTGLIFFM